MPIVLSFDIENAPQNVHARIQSAFERLGWQNLGGSSYRYPRLHSDPIAEDWFNHVIPALMVFRLEMLNLPTGTRLRTCTLDAQSSTGYFGDPQGHASRPPMPLDQALPAGKNIMYTTAAAGNPVNQQFGSDHLVRFCSGSEIWPY